MEPGWGRVLARWERRVCTGFAGLPERLSWDHIWSLIHTIEEPERTGRLGAGVLARAAAPPE